ncbi:MAG: hypothetical protein ACR2PL_24535 [Dehalococcoidia bacterium]
MDVGSVTQPDRQQVQQFGRRLFTVMVDGMLALLIDNGCREGVLRPAARAQASAQEPAGCASV